MRRLLLLLLSLIPVSVLAQIPPGGYGPGSGGSSGGITSPSSLTTFFSKYYGLAPQDCGNATCTVPGAKGDTHVYFDCGMTTNNHVTCTGSHFAATDVGKWIESCASAGCAVGATINAGTITAFNSATDVTTSDTSGTTYANTRLGFGTDDDAAMQNWALFMTQAPVLGVAPSTRGGYLPSGGYAIKQPLQIKYPGCATQGTCTLGEGGPNVGGTGTLRPSLWIAGQGTASTFIYVRTAASFTWPTQATPTAALYIRDFDFSSLTNFAVIADQSAHVTTGLTNPGVPAMIMNDNSTHAMWSGLWIQGGHNTTNNMCGFVDSGNDFESSYSYSAFESNDFDACIGLTNGSQIDKLQFNTNFLENPLQNQNMRIGNAFGGGLNLKMVSFANVHSLSGGTASVNFLNGVTTNLGETVQFYNWRQQNNTGAAGLGVVVNTTTGLNVDFHGSYFEDTNGAAGNLLIDNTSANATFNIYGGGLQCASCTNLFNNVGNIFVYGTKLTGPTVANIQTGAGNTYSFIPVAGANGGWTGKGTIQGTGIISNQGAACTNGELALSAGWQSTGSATVTAAAGTGQTCSWTITTGTTTAANPTVTDTLTNVLPAATTVCWMTVNGGTHTAIVGAGTADAFRQTTLSATAPIFTYQETPTAGGTTYFVTRTCGP